MSRTRLHGPLCRRPGTRTATKCSSFPRGRSRWAPTDGGSRTTTSCSRHRVDLDSFWIDARPVTNAQMVGFIEDGGYERRDWWSPEGWEWRQREGITSPRYWERDGRRLLRPFASTASTARPGQAPCATSPGSRPMRTRAARGSGCRPRPSGRRRLLGPDRTGRSGAIRGDADLEPMRAPTSTSSRSVRRRPAPIRPARAPMEWSRWPATSGNGRRADSTLSGLRGVPLPRVLGGLLRRPLQSAARRIVGDPTRWPADHASATGTTPSGGRSSRAFAAPATRRTD